MCGGVHAVCDKASSTCIATGFIPDDLVHQETFPTMCLSIVCPTAPQGYILERVEDMTQF